MTITPKQLEARKECIGASDVAAIVGESPFKDAFSLWCEKTGKVPAPEVGEAAEWGNLLEPVIMQQAGKVLGKRVVKPTSSFTHPDLAFVTVNPDGFVEASKRGNPIVEAKSTSIAEGWGEDGTDQVPMHVLIQVTMQMRCTDSAFAHVARLYHRMGHPDFKLYTIAFSKTFAELLDERVDDFWNNHVQKDIPPEPTALSLPVLGSIRRAAKVVPIEPAIVQAFTDARARVKEAEAVLEDAKAKLLHALGDGDSGEVPGWRVKYQQINTDRVDVDALRGIAPELVARCTKPSSYRKLDVRAIKEKSR